MSATLSELARRNHENILRGIVAVQKAKALTDAHDSQVAAQRQKRVKANLRRRLQLEDQWAAAMQEVSDRFLERLDIEAAYLEAKAGWKPVTAAARLTHFIMKAGAPKLEDIKLAEHTVQDVIDGKYKVGVEGDGGNDLQRARAHGLYTTTVNGIGIYAQDEKAAQPLINYLKKGGEYGTRQFSRLLGYTKAEIDAYFKFLEASRAIPTAQGAMTVPEIAAVQNQLLASAYALDIAQGVQIYLEMALNTSNVSGQAALDHMGINKTFSWAHPRAMASDLHAVRGSKVINNLYGAHLEKLSEMIRDATDPRHPKTLQEVKGLIKKEWPKLSAYQVARIARTETAAVWTATTANTYMANGITRVESIIAHGPSITIETGLPCDMCVDAAAAGPMSVLGDLPPWHPHCRCEIVPHMMNDDGTEWFPPDEPWVGGERPVCGLEEGLALSRRRSRGLRQMRAVLKASGVPGCLVPTSDPGVSFGGETFYNRKVNNADEALELQKQVNLWPDFQGDYSQLEVKAAARALIDKARAESLPIKIAVDQEGMLTSVALFEDNFLFSGMPQTITVWGIATKGSGARRVMGQFARDAYKDGKPLTVRRAGVSPQMQKSLDNWGFTPVHTNPEYVTLAPDSLKLPFKITDEIEAPPVKPTLNIDEPSPVPVHIEPPAPVAGLDESLDDLKAQLYTSNNKIAGHRKKIKTEQAKAFPNPQVISDFEQKLADEIVNRDSLKAKIKDFKNQPNKTPTKIDPDPPQVVAPVPEIASPPPPPVAAVGPGPANYEAGYVYEPGTKLAANTPTMLDNLVEESSDWVHAASVQVKVENMTHMVEEIVASGPSYKQGFEVGLMTLRRADDELMGLVNIRERSYYSYMEVTSMTLRYEDDAEAAMRAVTAAAKAADEKNMNLIVYNDGLPWPARQELMKRGMVIDGAPDIHGGLYLSHSNLKTAFKLDKEPAPTPAPAPPPSVLIGPAPVQFTVIKPPGKMIDESLRDEITQDMESWHMGKIGNKYGQEGWLPSESLLATGNEVSLFGGKLTVVGMRDSQGSLKGVASYVTDDANKMVELSGVVTKFPDDVETLLAATQNAARHADDLGYELRVHLDSVADNTEDAIKIYRQQLYDRGMKDESFGTFTLQADEIADKWLKDTPPPVGSLIPTAKGEAKLIIEKGKILDTDVSDMLKAETEDWHNSNLLSQQFDSYESMSADDGWSHAGILETRNPDGELTGLFFYEREMNSQTVILRYYAAKHQDDIPTIVQGTEALAKYAKSQDFGFTITNYAAPVPTAYWDDLLAHPGAFEQNTGVITFSVDDLDEAFKLDGIKMPDMPVAVADEPIPGSTAVVVHYMNPKSGQQVTTVPLDEANADQLLDALNQQGMKGYVTKPDEDFVIDDISVGDGAPVPDQFIKVIHEKNITNYPQKGDKATEILGDDKDTLQHFTTDGEWDEARVQLHNDIIAAHFAGKAPPPAAEREAFFTAGGAASGKSGMKFNYQGKEVDLDFFETRGDTIFIDPDRIKKLIPEYKEMQEAGDLYAASAVHEESSILSKMIAKRARDDGYNVVFDTTGSSGKFLTNIQDYADAGYKTHVSMVSIPTNEAIVRSIVRAQKVGGSSEGRFVPINALKQAHREASLQLIKWQKMKDLTEWRVYDNSGASIKLVAEKKAGGKPVAYDDAKFKEIKNKANEDKKRVTPKEPKVSEETSIQPNVPVAGLTVESMKAQLYTINNKIAGWKKKIKTHPENEAEWQSKIDELTAERDKLKEQIKDAGHKPTAAKPTTPKVYQWKVEYEGAYTGEKYSQTFDTELEAKDHASQIPVGESKGKPEIIKVEVKPAKKPKVKPAKIDPETGEVILPPTRTKAEPEPDLITGPQPDERRVVPGGITKERGTSALNKVMQQGYTGQGAAQLKRDIMNDLTAAVQADTRWTSSGRVKQYDRAILAANRNGVSEIRAAHDSPTGWSQIQEAFGYSDRAYAEGADKAVMAQLINNWARTSSNADWRGVIIQMAVKQEFGLDVRVFAADFWNDAVRSDAIVKQAEEIMEIFPDMMPALRAFVRAQYDQTQKLLTELGADEITLYRGMRIKSDAVNKPPEEGGVPWDAGLSTIRTTDNPIASWSIRHAVSRRSYFYGGTMLRASAPKEMIFSCPLTGFGCAGEYEVLIMNAGDNSAWVAQNGRIDLTPERIAEYTKKRDEAARLRDRIDEDMTDLKAMNGGAGPDWGTPEKQRLYELQDQRGQANRHVALYDQHITNGYENWSYQKETELRGHIQDAVAENPALAGKKIKVPRPKKDMTPEEAIIAEYKKKIGAQKRKITVARKKAEEQRDIVRFMEYRALDADYNSGEGYLRTGNIYSGNEWTHKNVYAPSYYKSTFESRAIQYEARAQKAEEEMRRLEGLMDEAVARHGVKKSRYRIRLEELMLRAV